MLVINLLPEQEQRAFERGRLEQTLRRFGLGSLLVILMFAASLFFLQMILNTRLADMEERLQQLFINERVKGVLEADQAVTDFNALLKEAAALEANRVFWSKTLVVIAAAAGEGIQLERLETTADRLVLISGQAATRAALLAYGEALRAAPTVKQVDSPLSNLVKERDAAFKFTVYLK